MAITLCKNCKNHCNLGYEYDCVNYTPNDVDEEVTTNEEWLNSLPIAEKAKFMANEFAIWWGEWLKEPYTENK